MKISKLLGAFCLAASFQVGAMEVDSIAPYISAFCGKFGGTLSVARADADEYLGTCSTGSGQQTIFTLDVWRGDLNTVRTSMRIPASVASTLAHELRDPLQEPLPPIVAGDMWPLLDLICADYGGSWSVRESTASTRLGSCVYGNRTAHMLAMDLESDFVILSSQSTK